MPNSAACSPLETPSKRTAGRSLTGAPPSAAARERARAAHWFARCARSLRCFPLAVLTEEHGPGQVTALHEFLRRSVELHGALLEEDGPVAQLGGDVQRLLDEHARAPGGVDLSDHLEQLAHDHRGEAEGELVDAEQRRVEQQGL